MYRAITFVVAGILAFANYGLASSTKCVFYRSKFDLKSLYNLTNEPTKFSPFKEVEYLDGIKVIFRTWMAAPKITVSSQKACEEYGVIGLLKSKVGKGFLLSISKNTNVENMFTMGNNPFKPEFYGDVKKVFTQVHEDSSGNKTFSSGYEVKTGPFKGQFLAIRTYEGKYLRNSAFKSDIFITSRIFVDNFSGVDAESSSTLLFPPVSYLKNKAEFCSLLDVACIK